MIKEFDGYELSDEWSKLLEIGDAYFYSEGACILHHQTYNGICVINSLSLKNADFPSKMLKKIIKIAKAHKNVIISSTVLEINSYMEKHGFIYNYKAKQYEKGISWE